MRKSRRFFLICAGLLTLLMSAIFIMTFVFVLIDFDGLKQYLIEQIQQNAMASGSMSVNSFVNFTLIYIMVSAIIGIVFAFVYFKYSRFTYPQFINAQKSLLILSIINLIVGFNIASLILVLITFCIKPSDAEISNLKQLVKNLKEITPSIGQSQSTSLTPSQQEMLKNISMQNPNNVKNDVFVNVNQIQIELTELREKFNRKEISEQVYQHELNKLLEKNMKG